MILVHILTKIQYVTNLSPNKEAAYFGVINPSSVLIVKMFVERKI